MAQMQGDTAKSANKRIKTRLINGTSMTSAADIVTNISRSKDHTILTGALVAATLTETLKTHGPMTVFAPTDAAFNKLPAGTLDTLLKPAHALDLTRLLTYHVVAGRLTSKDIAKQINLNNGTATFITLAGSPLKAKINADRNIVLVDENGNESIISQFDIETSNGIVDIVTAVLVPKSK
jgi:uncharacterized surface protein with fasciclin (FAS1) repeats